MLIEIVDQLVRKSEEMKKLVKWIHVYHPEVDTNMLIGGLEQVLKGIKGLQSCDDFQKEYGERYHFGSVDDIVKEKLEV